MNKFKFGDFCKDENGEILKVVHVPKSGTLLVLIAADGDTRYVHKRYLTPLPEYVDFDGPPKPRYYKDADLLRQIFVVTGDKCHWLLPKGETTATIYTLTDLSHMKECTEAEADAFLNPPPPKPTMRYFVAVTYNFIGGVVFFKSDGTNDIWVDKRGGETEASLQNLDRALGHCKAKAWKEITEQEALALLKPKEPVYVPWTFDTMPIGVKVKYKQDETKLRLATPKTEDTVYIAGQMYGYRHLFENYTQLDGTPCGTIKS